MDRPLNCLNCVYSKVNSLRRGLNDNRQTAERGILASHVQLACSVNHQKRLRNMVLIRFLFHSFILLDHLMADWAQHIRKRHNHRNCGNFAEEGYNQRLKPGYFMKKPFFYLV